MKKILALIGAVIFLAAAVDAAQAVELDYGKEIVVDSDLDGLTDLGEEKIFGTDKSKADTDGDGFFDGTEIMGGADALDRNNPSSTRLITESSSMIIKETPWAWYVARAAGLLAALLLYLDFFFGLILRIPFFGKIIRPYFSMKAHCLLSVGALFWVVIHFSSLLFDKYLNFKIIDVLLPLAANKFQIPIAWGITGFYLIVLLTVTSFVRRFINFKIWRIVHYANMILFVMVFIHALSLGTDLKNVMSKNVFIGINSFLILLILLNIFSKIKMKIVSSKATQNQLPGQQ